MGRERITVLFYCCHKQKQNVYPLKTVLLKCLIIRSGRPIILAEVRISETHGKSLLCLHIAGYYY